MCYLLLFVNVFRFMNEVVVVVVVVVVMVVLMVVRGVVFLVSGR